MQKLIIRADANTQIGTGHIMRCIALAQTWQDQGGDVIFLSNCDSEALRQRIIDEGFDFIPIEKPCPDISDLDQTLSVLTNETNLTDTLWLVIDGYHFTSDYQKAIRENGYKLLVIDDMAHLDHYHADILLNQNIHASSLHYSCDRDTVKLLGCEYVLLRREFFKYKDWKRVIPDKAKKILVTMGGSDPDNVMLKVIKALNSLNDQYLEVKIVAGPANPNINSLENELHLSLFTFHLLSRVSNMPEFMAWADMAISAGGSTCWEIAFMGLPSLIITAADNQTGIAKALGNACSGIDLGWHKNISMEQYRRAFKEILQDRSKRSYLSKKGQKLVNGKGVMKIIKAILVGQIKLRRAQKNDCKLLWKWANDPETRAASFSPVSIPWEDHTHWFSSKLNSANCMMYIAMLDDGTPLGQIRYDIKQENAVISISIDSKFRNRGYGAVLIRKTSQRLFNEFNVRKVHAYVKQENIASASVFTKAGFKKLELTTIHAQQATHFVLERFTS
ncbi:MAG: UDP-2,4-diacetamido-2,4,6-trideoxy-beta-L-altropyranose hydrolase [Deltaproteobacteria bacterium]|nr:UDP-2,4-diacetamido-2,4,6-trideoxy-beta-L-altropyranose hydrolase [Deltaproteobacteria bacterium]